MCLLTPTRQPPDGLRGATSAGSSLVDGHDAGVTVKCPPCGIRVNLGLPMAQLLSPRVSVEHFRVRSLSPYREGFEQVEAVATVVLDAGLPGNGFVVDLGRAPRRPDGLVQVETDVVLIRPAGTGPGSPSPTGLLFVVANRGLVTGLPFSWGVQAGAIPDGRIDPGDAWVLRRGLAVAWIGWQWDVQRRPGVVGIDVPEARHADGGLLRSQARLEFLPLQTETHHRLADQVPPWIGTFHALPAADVEEAGAVLTVRDWFNGPRTEIPRSRWCFARDVDGTAMPDTEHVWLDGGFAPRRYYEVIYTTGRSPIAGAGLAAVRDVVSYLRTTMEFSRVLSTGSSQSGRWLRQFIFDTANTAEDGSRVFDGVLCHIAGGRRGEFNNRSAQPSTMNALGFTHEPPFSPEDGLFAAARRQGNAPLTIFDNSATEYWRGDASLVHTDGAGRDLADGEDWRAYLCAGAHHPAGMPEEFAAQFPLRIRSEPDRGGRRPPRPPDRPGRVGRIGPAAAAERGAAGCRRFRPEPRAGLANPGWP